jgi:inhibitor of KinA sporulation pathway (predicted exonuclease)
MMTTYMGRPYPLVKYDGRNLLVDRARALLLFVEALVALLAEKQGRLAPAISSYVDEDMRSLAPLASEGYGI